MSLRIVRVIPFYAPATQFGGVVAQAAKISARLAARGHRVQVVTTDNGIGDTLPRDTWIDRDGYRIYYASTRPWHRVVPYPAPRMRPALREAIPGADVCTLNVGLTLAHRPAVRIAAAHGVPWVYNAEGALCPERLQLKGTAKRAFLALVERRILARTAACQAVTRKEATDLTAQGVAEERIHTIPNGIEPFVQGDGAAFRARFGIAEDQVMALYFGRLHRVKGIERLVEAFDRIDRADAHLVLAGHDGDGTGARLQERVQTSGLASRVHFAGHLEATDQRAALTGADLFALTSHSEGLPNAVLEALAAGLPCLLTEMCNVPEVGAAGAGLVVPGTDAAIEAGLRTLLDDAPGRLRMAAAARRLAAETFDLDRVVDRLEALYVGLAAGGPALTASASLPAAAGGSSAPGAPDRRSCP